MAQQTDSKDLEKLAQLLSWWDLTATTAKLSTKVDLMIITHGRLDQLGAGSIMLYEPTGKESLATLHHLELFNQVKMVL